MQINQYVQAHTVIVFESEKAHGIGEMFREMADYIDSLGSDSVEVQEVVYTRDSDAQGWPVWHLTAYVRQFKREGQ